MKAFDNLVQWKTSDFNQNLIKVLNDLVQWDQQIHSKSNEITRQTMNTFLLVIILKLFKTFWPISTFSKEIFCHILSFAISSGEKNGGYYSLIHQSIHPSIHPNIHGMQFIQKSIHPNGGARLTYFSHEFPQHQLCNNMILPWKAGIISVLIAGLDLDVSGSSKYAPPFILHLYFYFAGIEKFIWHYYSLVHTECIWTR